MPPRVLAVGLVALLAACAAINPFRLDDQIAVYHDDLRWGRMPAASQAVAASARARFTQRHAHWGRGVQILDLDLENTQVTGLVAAVRARYQWTRPAETDVRETIVETRWRAGANGSWSVDDERIVGGDPSLLAVLATPAATPAAAAPTMAPDGAH